MVMGQFEHEDLRPILKSAQLAAQASALILSSSRRTRSASVSTCNPNLPEKPRQSRPPHLLNLVTTIKVHALQH